MYNVAVLFGTWTFKLEIHFLFGINILFYSIVSTEPFFFLTSRRCPSSAFDQILGGLRKFCVKTLFLVTLWLMGLNKVINLSVIYIWYIPPSEISPHINENRCEPLSAPQLLLFPCGAAARSPPANKRHLKQVAAGWWHQIILEGKCLYCSGRAKTVAESRKTLQ